MESIITATFKLVVRSGRQLQLFFDEDFMELLGIKDNSDPEGNFLRWRECVHPDDLPLISEAISSTRRDVKSEVKYRWNHKTLGMFTAYSSGMLVSDVGGRAVIYGYFKGVPENMTQLFRYDPDLQLLTRLFAEKLMDSFSFCALTNVSEDRMLILNDTFNTSNAAGRECSYTDWLFAATERIHEDDRRRFFETIAKESLAKSFRSTDEVHGELRIRNGSETAWVNLRFIRMKQRIAGKYHEFIVIRNIAADHRAVYMEELRNQLINRLAVPYHTIDLINLKSGSFYSSSDKKGGFAEHFSKIGTFNDAVKKYADSGGFSRQDRDAIIFNINVESMKKRFSAGETLIELEFCRHIGENAEWLRLQVFMSDTDDDGNPSMAILTIQPITAEKLRELRYQQRLERALRSESQYRQAILSNAVAVYTYNVTRDTIYDEVIEQEGVNPLLPVLKLPLPCSYDEYIKRKSRHIIDKQLSELFCRDFCRASLLKLYGENRRSFDTEYEFSGERKVGFFREAVILTKDMETGDIWGLTYVRDITEEHNRATQVEQALRAAFTEAQHANSAKTMFMSQMSHDIRTPLNSILGMSAIAQEHISDTARVSDCLNKILTSGKHLLEIVNNVLDLSAIESDKTTLAQVPFSLNEFVDDIEGMIRPLAEAKCQSIEISVGEGINTAVIGDKAKLNRLVANILSNAVKYTPNGGKISLRVRELPHEHSDISRLLFTVEDNGIGMKPEFMQHIFDPFVRADDRRISGIQGTGLGMSIALSLAQMMNGDISVKSELGKGSRFDITVCLKADSLTIKHAGAQGAAGKAEQQRKLRMSDCDFGGRRVLIAEDLAFNAEIAAEFLAEARLLTETAENGEQAVKMFEASPAGYYSLILMDIQMPVLDGYQATRQIRALPRDDAKAIPIVAMTANAFVEDIKKATDCGMNGHISKPLDVAEMIRELTKQLGKV